MRNILIIYYFAITQKYPKIVFEYESLAIFAGNTQKYSCSPLYFKQKIRGDKLLLFGSCLGASALWGYIGGQLPPEMGGGGGSSRTMDTANSCVLISNAPLRNNKQ